MRHITTYLLLMIGIACAYAVPIYEYDTPAPLGFHSHKILSAGTIYQGGTTYVPFDDAAPSDYTEVGAYHSSNRAPGSNGPRRGFGQPTDPGYQGNGYPIGDAWCLLIFGALFAGVIAWRKRNKTRATPGNNVSHHTL